MSEQQTIEVESEDSLVLIIQGLVMQGLTFRTIQIDRHSYKIILTGGF